MKYFFLISLWMVLIDELSADALVIASGESFCVDSLDIDEIRGIYLAKKFRVSGHKIIPVHLGIDHPLRLRFEHSIVNEERESLSHIWLQAHYLGHRAPTVFKSQETVAEFLSKVKDSLGYVEESTAQKYHLKILYRGHE